MAYYFAVETEEKSYVAKKIRNSRYFGSEYSSINGSYECTLEEIDRFTSQYNRIETLSYELYSENKVQFNVTEDNNTIYLTGLLPLDSFSNDTINGSMSLLSKFLLIFINNSTFEFSSLIFLISSTV